jgi:glutamate 5-kinase
LGRELVSSAKRIVIKVGTRVVTEKENKLSNDTIGALVGQVSEAAKEKDEIIIVSSGAIALGLSRMGMEYRPQEIDLLQAAAALGQSRLMHAYEEEFAKSSHEIAQILLTYEDIQNRRRYLNIRNTIFALWSNGAIPIVNENDTVSFSEIRFGDNDILAAYLSSMIDADLLLILTDTDGVFEENPMHSEKARIIEEIHAITDELMGKAFGSGSSFSSGGMESKLRAAEIATKSGVAVVIASGIKMELRRILKGENIGTYFVPSERKIRGRKKWIAFNPKIEGSVIIDRGGEQAIVTGNRSLLPVGVKQVIGRFGIGSNISIQNEDEKELARGLSNFSSDEIEKIKGLNTKKIPQVLGTDLYFDEIVHRDNMVILV